jgi:hypothetical protein
MSNQIPYCPATPDENAARPMLIAWQNFLAANPELNGTRALYFSMEDVQSLGSSAVGFRVYFGLHTVNGKQVFDGMIVGVDANGADIVDPSSPNSGIWDFASPCPTMCDSSNGPMYNPDGVPCS